MASKLEEFEIAVDDIIENGTTVVLGPKHAAAARDEILRLRKLVEQLQECVEIVSIGQKIECLKCGNFKPCCCDK